MNREHRQQRVDIYPLSPKCRSEVKRCQLDLLETPLSHGRWLQNHFFFRHILWKSNICMENGPLIDEHLLIVHSYDRLPAGILDHSASLQRNLRKNHLHPLIMWETQRNKGITHWIRRKTTLWSSTMIVPYMIKTILTWPKWIWMGWLLVCGIGNLH